MSRLLTTVSFINPVTTTFITSSYLLASTKTLTLTGPDVNIAARIPNPKITFTK